MNFYIIDRNVYNKEFFKEIKPIFIFLFIENINNLKGILIFKKKKKKNQ
jgi:hypothetical protein